MSNEAMFQRDVLFPADNLFEPGCVHISVLGPTKDASIPVIVESKTNHSPITFIDTIIRVMQNDIFDRIYINVKKTCSVYIKSNDTTQTESEGKNYVKVTIENDKYTFAGVDEIEE